MRFRFILLVLAILLVAGFAALNWSEVIRPAPLLFGAVVMDAPLGAILLGLLALAVVIFAISAGAMRTESLLESRKHYKTLEEQRALADRAEASRFTDLRQHLDSQLRELRQRDQLAASEFEKAVVQGQQELRHQLEQINRTLAARLAEIEHRLDTRLDRLDRMQAPASATPVMAPPLHPRDVPVVPPHEPVLHEPLRPDPLHGALERHEHAEAGRMYEPREPTLRDHPVAAERLRQQHAIERAEEERAQERARQEAPDGRSGWRRWF